MNSIGMGNDTKPESVYQKMRSSSTLISYLTRYATIYIYEKDPMETQRFRTGSYKHGLNTSGSQVGDLYRFDQAWFETRSVRYYCKNFHFISNSGE